MIFKLYESKEKCRAKRFHDTTEIYLSRFSDLFVEDGIKKIVIDSITLFLFSDNDSLLNDMYEAVVNNYDYNKIIEILNKNDVIGSYNNEYFNCIFKKNNETITYQQAIE